MGTVHKFKKRSKNAQRFKGPWPSPSNAPKRQPRGRWRWGYNQAMLATLVVSIGGLITMSVVEWTSTDTNSATLTCRSAKILDGDTFDCGATRVRLAGIDAPELEGHCRPGRKCAPGDPYASTEHLRSVIGSEAPQCRRIDIDVYGRVVARCTVGKTDLSCAQLKGGYAIRRYGFIFC